MQRLTERDEFGNADIIGVDSGELQGNLDFQELNRVTRALNRLAEFEDKLESGQLVELPCKVGDTVYIVGNYDCAQGHTEDEKLKRKIYLHCVKIEGNCDRCKYAAPKMEEFVCSHIQISKEGVLVCGERCQGFLSDRIFTDKAQAEARLKELQEQKNG